MNAEVCCEQMKLYRRELGRRRHRPGTRQHDNAHHVAQRTQIKLLTMGWGVTRAPALLAGLVAVTL